MRKALEAFLALEGLLARMQTFVFGKVMLVLESLFAYITLVWTLIGRTEKKKGRAREGKCKSQLPLKEPSRDERKKKKNKKRKLTWPECSYLWRANELCLLKVLSH